MQDLVVNFTFDAPPKKVWTAWTEPEQLKRWWGPASFTSPFSEIDLRVGGKYLSAMRSPDGQTYWSTGVYTQINVNHSFEVQDSFADEKGNIVPASYYGMPREFPLKSRMKVLFEDFPEGKTRLTVTQFDAPEGPIREMTTEGRLSSFKKLAAVLK